MSSQTNRIAPLLVGCLVAFSMVGLGGTGIVASEERLDVTVDTPSEVTKGEQANLSASITTPDLVGSYESQLSVTFYSNGTQIGSNTLTVSDGDTAEVNTSHTFENAGEKTILVEATVTLAGQEFSGDGSKSITVIDPKTEISIDGDLQIRIGAPDAPTVNNESTSTIHSQIPTITGTDNATLALRLYVDGQQTASKTISVHGNETTETDFTTIFDSSGETTLTIEAELTAGNLSVNESVSTTVNVSKAPPETITVSGAAFAMPESLKDEANETRQELPDASLRAFVLATNDSLYVVFTNTTPKKGSATIQGQLLETTVSEQNLTFGVITATSTDITQDGRDASVQEVTTNASEYQLNLVEISDHYRRISTLYDPDNEENTTASLSTGILTNRSLTGSIFNRTGQRAGRLLSNTAGERNKSAQAIKTQLGQPSTPHIYTFNFETNFWFENNATVDGIVLAPGSPARQFVTHFDQTTATQVAGNSSLLYVVRTQYNSASVENVSAINERHQSLDGEILTVETRVNGSKISVQEFVEHNTGCGEDQANLSACVNIVLDELVHTGVAWNTVPNSNEEILPLLGVSSHHQDTPERVIQGRYRITGELVSASRLNDSLSNGSALLVYNITRIGDLNRSEVTNETRQALRETRERLRSSLLVEINAEIPIKLLKTTLQGAAFPVPESLQDEVNEYRANLERDLAPHTFVLATHSKRYIVFTRSKPLKGRVTVTGWSLSQNLSWGTKNLTFGGILSISDSFMTTGESATVHDVATNASAYQFDLVNISAHYRRISTLTDPDAGGGITFSTTAGVLMNSSRDGLFKQSLRKSTNSLINRSVSQNRSVAVNELKSFLEDTRDSHLHTFSFETAFWVNANTSVDAIVLDPESAAYEFVNATDRANFTYAEPGEPLLYVVDTFSPTHVENVSQIKRQADSLDGNVISLETRLHQLRLSPQEILEHNTGCDETVLEIQTPQGPVCVNLVQDSLLHGGVAWNTVPTSREETLFVTGISSRHQDAQTDIITGRYRITGEVVSVARLSETLPRLNRSGLNASMLLVYDLARVQDINYSAVENESRAIIENQTDAFTPSKQELLTSSTRDISDRTALSLTNATAIDLPDQNGIVRDGDAISINVTVVGNQSAIKNVIANVSAFGAGNVTLTDGNNDSRYNATVLVNASGASSTGIHRITVLANDTSQNVATIKTNPLTRATCIKKPIAGKDNKISLTEIQRAINWWAEGKTVPDTGGETISLSEIQQLINAWAEGTAVTC